MKYVVIFFIVFLMGCNEKEDQPVSLIVRNIELDDIGRIPYNFQFDAVSEEDHIVKCRIRTLYIKKNDRIKSIDALNKEKALVINIISYPYDFNCDTCLTVHDLYFELIGLKQQKYDINISINNIQINPFDYEIQ